jgi:hypothetical protein
LLLTVLVGLLRLRHDGGGFHGLVQLLWKQVRGSISPFAGVLLTYCRVSLFKGVIWLLFACAAEIPPVVCLVSCIFPSEGSPLFYDAGIHHFEFEWYFSSLRKELTKNVDQRAFCPEYQRNLTPSVFLCYEHEVNCLLCHSGT